MRTNGSSSADSASGVEGAVPNGVHRPRYDRPLFILALLTALATFPMIFLGGLVTSHHAGMSVPDWPNSYHYNMFLFPPRLWIGGILYEHTHRLMGTVVGFLSLLLTAYAWQGLIFETRKPSLSTRWICLAVLIGVIFQGVLGGLRVVLINLDLAIAHACVAQAFFCLATWAAIVTSRWWIDLDSRKTHARDRVLVGLSVATVCAIFLQLIVGATMRHFDAGLAIPDLPLAYHHWLPPTSSAALEPINHLRVWEMNLDQVTLSQIWLAFAHRLGAIVVALAVLSLAWRVLSRHRSQPVILRWALFAAALLACQVTLGIFTVLYRKPADVASAHVAIGALLLVSTFVVMVASAALNRRSADRPAWQATPDAKTQAVSRGTVPAWS